MFGSVCPPTWAIIFTGDRILTRSASGNQVEGQTSKDLSDKVNSKRDASMSFQLFTWKPSIFQTIFNTEKVCFI